MKIFITQNQGFRNRKVFIKEFYELEYRQK
nr:MAG TPA: hypothetical protein [Caudoviricetes sp.]